MVGTLRFAHPTDRTRIVWPRSPIMRVIRYSPIKEPSRAEPHTPAFSRRVLRPSFAKASPSKNERAQGRPGADRTHGPRATKKHAAEPQVRAEQPAFPAQWFYGLYALSPVTRLCCHRCLRDAKHHRTRSASLGAPGPHDFAVRKSHVRLSQALASTASHRNVRDDRDPPLIRRETGEVKLLICPTS